MSDIPAIDDSPEPRRLARLIPWTRRGGESAIVPKSSISGRALVAVVAIMTFLGSLTIGAVTIVLGAAADWQSEVAREVTIQVRPMAGRDIEADVAKAAELARAAPAIAEVRPFSQEESARLLEPWLGSGVSLESLPVPRLIVVRVKPGQQADFSTLRAALAAQVPGASLDDHRSWIERMRAMTDSAVIGGLTILALVLAATVLSVTFATRGAMATNRPIVEVLHFIGAKEGYIAGQFQRHFLALGLEGGAIGGATALVLFALLQLMGERIAGPEGGILFGTLSIGAAGYLAVVAQVVLIAVVTAWTSRRVVNRTLKGID
jgi:cell division transport system permease protein